MPFCQKQIEKTTETVRSNFMCGYINVTTVNRSLWMRVWRNEWTLQYFAIFSAAIAVTGQSWMMCACCRIAFKPT